MEVETILSFVGACIVSAGGIGGIIIAVIHFTSNMIADHLKQKYQNDFEKELEKYKTQLDNKNYISKTRFDAEFDLYRSLNKAFLYLVKDISVMIPRGFVYVPADEDDRKQYDENNYITAKKHTRRHKIYYLQIQPS